MLPTARHTKPLAVLAFLGIAGGAVTACSTADEQGTTQDARPPSQGYVLKQGEGEALYEGSTLVKVSPKTGSQGAEMFWSSLDPGFSTGIHFHHVADEFFYVVSGTGLALVGDTEVPIEAGDVVFVPARQDHRIRTSGDGPLEIIYLVDKPGLADEFRESHLLSQGGKIPMTLEQANAIAAKYGATYKTIE